MKKRRAKRPVFRFAAERPKRPGLRCHMLREDRRTYCGYRAPRGYGLVHGGLAVADCKRCLRAAVAAGEMDEWLKLDTHSELVRSVRRTTVRRLKRLGIL